MWFNLSRIVFYPNKPLILFYHSSRTLIGFNFSVSSLFGLIFQQSILYRYLPIYNNNQYCSLQTLLKTKTVKHCVGTYTRRTFIGLMYMHFRFIIALIYKPPPYITINYHHTYRF